MYVSIRNWFNFRNCRYTKNRETVELTIDKDFLKAPPHIGTIEFDYVSTTLPPDNIRNSIPKELESDSRDHSKSPKNRLTEIKPGISIITDEEFIVFIDHLVRIYLSL